MTLSSMKSSDLGFSSLNFQPRLRSTPQAGNSDWAAKTSKLIKAGNMSKALITYKQNLNLKKGLNINKETLKTIYKNLLDVLKDAEEYQNNSDVYISLEGETNIGDIKAASFEDFLMKS